MRKTQNRQKKGRQEMVYLRFRTAQGGDFIAAFGEGGLLKEKDSIQIRTHADAEVSGAYVLPADVTVDDIELAINEALRTNTVGRVNPQPRPGK